MHDGSIGVGKVVTPEPRLTRMEFGPPVSHQSLKQQSLKQQPLEHPAEDRQQSTRSEVRCIARSTRILRQEAYLGQIPRAARLTMGETEVVQPTEPAE